jgi:hypothetical protein
MLILSNLSGPVKNLTRENPIKMPWYLNKFLTPDLARIKNDIRKTQTIYNDKSVVMSNSNAKKTVKDC